MSKDCYAQHGNKCTATAEKNTEFRETEPLPRDISEGQLKTPPPCLLGLKVSNVYCSSTSGTLWDHLAALFLSKLLVYRGVIRRLKVASVPKSTSNHGS